MNSFVRAILNGGRWKLHMNKGAFKLPRLLGAGVKVSAAKAATAAARRMGGVPPWLRSQLKAAWFKRNARKLEV